MTNGKKSAQAEKKRKLGLATPRALLRKHAHQEERRVELKKGWFGVVSTFPRLSGEGPGLWRGISDVSHQRPRISAPVSAR
jgi:hypothetical protein